MTTSISTPPGPTAAVWSDSFKVWIISRGDHIRRFTIAVRKDARQWPKELTRGRSHVIFLSQDRLKSTLAIHRVNQRLNSVLSRTTRIVRECTAHSRGNFRQICHFSIVTLSPLQAPTILAGVTAIFRGTLFSYSINSSIIAKSCVSIELSSRLVPERRRSLSKTRRMALVCAR